MASEILAGSFLLVAQYRCGNIIRSHRAGCAILVIFDNDYHWQCDLCLGRLH